MKIFLLLILLSTSNGFQPQIQPILKARTNRSIDHGRRRGSVVRRVQSTDDAIMECVTMDEQESLKRSLFQLAASYDRGFGASTKARQNALKVLEQLERASNVTNAAQNVDGQGTELSPLKGAWRMIWTTASDVLVLGASPLTAPGAIYQVFEPPIVTNIIDFLPRIQSLSNMIPTSLLRAKVQTRASPRREDPNRVGLVFEKVNFQPLQVLGQSIDAFPPLGLDLPQIPGTMDPSNGPGYFDVTFLDQELLIIRQNAPGGLFALLKVDSTEA